MQSDNQACTWHCVFKPISYTPYTLAVGGNHEASNHLWELHYGGWVAPNIYYLGAAGVVNFGGVRIAGLTGIFNPRHYRMVSD